MVKFLVKLYDMLSDPTISDIICWSDDGQGVNVRSPSRLESELLVRYEFKTEKYSTFQRQLNYYGFKKCRHGKDMYIFKHPDFHRDDCSKVALMKTRRRASQQSNSGSSRGDSSRVQLSSSVRAASGYPPSDALIPNNLGNQFSHISNNSESDSVVVAADPRGFRSVSDQTQLQNYSAAVEPPRLRAYSQPNLRNNGSGTDNATCAYYGTTDTELLEGLAELALTRSVAQYVLQDLGDN